MVSHRAGRAQGPPVLEPGTRIGDRYVLVRSLGEGGMGQVFEVEHEAIGRHFALKVLNINPCTDEVLRRFHREARALGRIATPRVAQVTDFGFEQGLGPFYVMELLDGETLEQRLQREHHLPLDQAIPIAIELCEALTEVHGAGVIHRDLKPSNVGLMRLGPVRVKLLDFGLATAADVAVLERITKSQEVVGSLPYMAPERFYNAPLTLSIDLYSLGVMLYEMLSGALPYQGLSAAVLINQHLNQPPPPFSRIAPGLQVPTAIETIAMRLLHKDPAQRFASAADVSQALRAASAVAVATLSDAGIASTVYADDLDGAGSTVPGVSITSEDWLPTIESPDQPAGPGPNAAPPSPFQPAAGIPTSVVPDGVPLNAWARPISPTVFAEGGTPIPSQSISYPQQISPPPAQARGWISEPVPPTTYSPTAAGPGRSLSPRWQKLAAIFAAGVVGSILATILFFVLFSHDDAAGDAPGPAATPPSPVTAPPASLVPTAPRPSGLSPDLGTQGRHVAPPVIGPGTQVAGPTGLSPISGAATPAGARTPDAGARARPQAGADSAPRVSPRPPPPRPPTPRAPTPPPRTKRLEPWRGEVIEDLDLR